MGVRVEATERPEVTTGLVSVKRRPMGRYCVPPPAVLLALAAALACDNGFLARKAAGTPAVTCSAWRAGQYVKFLRRCLRGGADKAAGGTGATWATAF